CERRGHLVSSKLQTQLEDVIRSRTERLIIQALRSHGPVLSGYELVDRVVREGGGEVALNLALCYSPILQRVAFGVYTLRGQIVDAKAIAEAVGRASHHRGRVVDYGWGRRRTLWITVRLSP